MKDPDEYIENIEKSIEQISKIKDKIIDYRELKNGLKVCKIDYEIDFKLFEKL